MSSNVDLAFRIVALADPKDMYSFLASIREEKPSHKHTLCQTKYNLLRRNYWVNADRMIAVSIRRHPQVDEAFE